MLPVERKLSIFNEEVVITAVQYTVSWCFHSSSDSPILQKLSLSEWEVQSSISASLSSKTDPKQQDFSHYPHPGCLAGPRQVGTTCCQLSANFQLGGLVSCVLPLLWAADLTELVAWATASAKDPPLCFPWRPDTLIIWGIAEDVGGVWSGCQMSFEA